MLRIKHFSLLLIAFASWTPNHRLFVSGQWGENRGPIYLSHQNPYCQRNLVPHYPVREDWVLGSWKLMYEYKQTETYNSDCKTVDIKKPFSSYLSTTMETSTRVLTTFERFPNSSDMAIGSDTFVAYHGGPGIEARYMMDKTDGLFSNSSEFHTISSAMVFLGFTSKLKETQGELEPYDTALYAVCSHKSAADDFDVFYSEVGILSKSGDVSEIFLNYYMELLDTEDIMDPTLLQPVNQNCDTAPAPEASGRAFDIGSSKDKKAGTTSDLASFQDRIKKLKARKAQR